ncbi:hypothetical protein [Kitasatospora sp. NBC_01266]|uniref:hypothetical protein n=1 Tax=Kitasatospora sp. NBC_01266 TaxID=2903572 RepID=UPI002E3178A4|nr:hypothetical protein [Kitasatospora sp. NBC_01266]
MSDAIPSYGFTAARKGYAPEQVDRALGALTAQRDHAWHRLSQLGAQIRELETALAAARQAAAEAPEPDYSTLSEQAGDLMAIAENETRQIREKAERFSTQTRDAVAEAGRTRQSEAAAYATATRAEADEAARRTEVSTRAAAEKLRTDAEQDARACRDAATAESARIRVAAAEAGERAEAKLAELRRDADERFAAEEAAAAAEDAKISLAAEHRLKEAEQHRETTLGVVKQIDTDAQAKADQLIETARREAEQINARTAAERAEFDKRLETVQTHLDHIKGTLASLTGKAVGMIEPGQVPAAALAAAAPAAPALDSEADTGEVPLPAAPEVAVPEAVAADAPTTVLRMPAELFEATVAQPQIAQPQPAQPQVDPRTALRAAGAAQPPVPPRPATPPPAPPQAPSDPAAETTLMPRIAGAPRNADETAVIPKIVIIDDEVALDSLPNTVGRRRS